MFLSHRMTCLVALTCALAWSLAGRADVTQDDLAKAEAAAASAAADADAARAEASGIFYDSERGKALAKAITDAQAAREAETAPQGRLDAAKRISDAKRKLESERVAAVEGDSTVKTASAQIASAQAKLSELRAARDRRLAEAAAA